MQNFQPLSSKIFTKQGVKNHILILQRVKQLREVKSLFKFTLKVSCS